MNNLPNWNLTDFYPSHTHKSVSEDIAKLTRLAEDFKNQYVGKVEKLATEDLYSAILQYEIIQDIAGKLSSYAYLLFATDNSKDEITAFYQNISEKVSDIFSDLIFFTLSINKIDDSKLEQMLSESTNLKAYKSWLDDVRALKPYQLSDEIEKILLEMNVSGRSSWIRLFDEFEASLKFNISNEELTISEVLNLMSNPDANKRKMAAKEIAKVFAENIRTFALITNTLAKDKQTEDKWRGYKKPISERNVSNRVEDEVVEALVHSVKSNYQKLSHRYYKYKAGLFGKKSIDYWDRNAPLPNEDDKNIDWNSAKEIVLSSYDNFSKQLGEIGRKFFDNAWIDAEPRKGKASGAFSHPTVPSVHPYILMNYHGKVRDVMTLAHELGHGVHQVLTAQHGALMADTPLTLAETASVFGEQLTFRELLKREQDTNKRKNLIAHKVEDMLNTVVRQIAFLEFERILHDERKNGELTAERIGEIWMSTQKEALGEAITLHPEYNVFWAYIPHFVHSPFYVYSYAFGDLLVNSLYSVYLNNEVDNFESKYIELLKAGGTLSHKELLKPFGLDATDPKFWDKGISVISGFIDELEK